MKNFKKVIASLTSAAMVFGMVSLTPMSSVAAVTLPDVEGPQYAICSDGNIYDAGREWNPENPLPDGVNVLVRLDKNVTSFSNLNVDNTNKTVTITGLNINGGIDFDYKGYTYVFNGENSFKSRFAIDGFTGEGENITIVAGENSSIDMSDFDESFYTEESPVVLDVKSGGRISLSESACINKNARITLSEDTIVTDTELSTRNSIEAYWGPITFTNKNSSTISDDEEETTSEDETDDSTTGDTTDKTDDATTDDTTSDDSSDDEATTGDSSDGETESPNVIEGKDLSWNTVDATGKSYWYENGVKQGTVDDPKAVSYDGAVRGREIYDPESMEWYWLDANSNGARAVNKEVFVPYIYQDQGNWTADDVMNNAKLSDGGLNGVGGTVYSAMINKTGKWIRYDAKGAMIKGWYTVEGAEAELYPTQKGNTYYYDTKTGTMAKGDCVIDGVLYHFDGLTGALKK